MSLILQDRIRFSLYFIWPFVSLGIEAYLSIVACRRSSLEDNGKPIVFAGSWEKDMHTSNYDKVEPYYRMNKSGLALYKHYNN